MSYIISVAKRPIYERKPLGPFCCVGLFGEVSNFDCARRSFILNGDSPNGTLSASELKDAYKAAEPRNGWGPLRKGTRTPKLLFRVRSAEHLHD